MSNGSLSTLARATGALVALLLLAPWPAIAASIAPPEPGEGDQENADSDVSGGCSRTHHSRSSGLTTGAQCSGDTCHLASALIVKQSDSGIGAPASHDAGVYLE